jgi:tRNA-binding protein
MVNCEEFVKVDIRAGTVVKSESATGLKKPAVRLWIDFGPLGIKKSSAQITHHYTPEGLLGKQVVCVTNFPPKQIGNFISEVLVTGFADENDQVVLCNIDKKVPNGAKLF